jgi:hypothetical protein
LVDLLLSDSTHEPLVLTEEVQQWVRQWQNIS